MKPARGAHAPEVLSVRSDSMIYGSRGWWWWAVTPQMQGREAAWRWWRGAAEWEACRSDRRVYIWRVIARRESK